MNIDSTIEDLEAQAYFASKTETSIRSTPLSLEVISREEIEPAKRLSIALVGLDFVAGFTDTNYLNNTNWQLIPNTAVSSISVLFGDLESALVELTMSDFLASKLIREHVLIKIATNNSPAYGKLLQVFGNFAVVDSGSVQLIGLQSIQWLAVDKLSKSIRT